MSIETFLYIYFQFVNNMEAQISFLYLNKQETKINNKVKVTIGGKKRARTHPTKSGPALPYISFANIHLIVIIKCRFNKKLLEKNW